MLPPSAPAWTILGVWTSVKPWPVRYSRKARDRPSCILNTARSFNARRTTGRRPSSVSRFSFSRPLDTGTGMGWAGRDSISSPVSRTSSPPGARLSSATWPVRVTAHSSLSSWGSSSGAATHCTAPSGRRRVRKVTPPRGRRAWTMPSRVTVCPTKAARSPLLMLFFGVPVTNSITLVLSQSPAIRPGTKKSRGVSDYDTPRDEIIHHNDSAVPPALSLQQETSFEPR